MIRIREVDNLSLDKRTEIAKFLQEKFRFAVEARSKQVDTDYKRWIDNYAAKPLEKVRSTPFYRASNFVPSLIRMHTDIMSARLIGIICATKPIWKPRSLIGDLPREWLEGLGQWLEYVSQFQINLFDAWDDGIFRVCKNGVVVFKAPWTGEAVILVGADGTEVPHSEEGICLSAIPFEDFWPYPITARNLKHCIIKFHRVRLSREELNWRINTHTYDEANAKLLLLGGAQQPEPVRQAKAEAAGITLTTDVDRPFSAIEACFDYELTPGKKYKLIAVFNPNGPADKALLRLYYNYYSRPMDFYVDARIWPKEDSFYGTPIPEVLEQAQEEQAQIHNARRDANTIANIPGWKKKRYADVPNPSSEWYPGKCFELENLDDLDILQFPVKYNDMLQEEQFLLSLSSQYTGVTPPMQGPGQGILEGKRGIYNSGGTLALLAEGNRRLDIYIRRLRMPFHNLGNLIYQSHKDFRPNGAEYTAYGETGAAVTRTFQFKEPDGFKGLFFEIGASDGSANREIDRTNLLLMANTMASYYRQVVEAGTLLMQVGGPQTPIGQILLMVLDGARDLADRLLFAYDIGDRKKVLPDIRNILGASPAESAAVAGRAGLPESEEPVPITGLQDLSRRASSIASAARAGAFGGRG